MSRPASATGRAACTSAPRGTRPTVRWFTATELPPPPAPKPPIESGPCASATTPPSGPRSGVGSSVPPCRLRASPIDEAMHVDAPAVLHVGADFRGHDHGGDVLDLHRVGRHGHAEPLEHAGQRLRGEDGLLAVAGLVEADHQPVADGRHRRRRPAARQCPSAACRPPTSRGEAGAGERQADRDERAEQGCACQKTLLRIADEPARIEVVLHQALAEVADLHLPDGGRRHDVARTDVGRADDAAEHDELRSPLMSTSRMPSSTRSPLGSTSTTRAVITAVSDPLRAVAPLPVKPVLALDGRERRRHRASRGTCSRRRTGWSPRPSRCSSCRAPNRRCPRRRCSRPRARSRDR